MCLLQERVSFLFSNYWLLSNLSVFLYLCEAGSRMGPFHVISFCGLAVQRVVFGAAASPEDDRAGCTTRCFVFHLGPQNLALSNFQLLKQSALALSVAKSRIGWKAQLDELGDSISALLLHELTRLTLQASPLAAALISHSELPF